MDDLIPSRVVINIDFLSNLFSAFREVNIIETFELMVKDNN